MNKTISRVNLQTKYEDMLEKYETRVQGGDAFDLYMAPGGGVALEFIKE